MDGSTIHCIRIERVYTSDGIALTDTVLGGLAVEDNLLEALRNAEFDAGYSHETFAQDFADGKSGEICFTYNGIKETLSYVPVTGTNRFLTYLIRESVITENISAISDGILRRSMIQTVITLVIMIAMFVYILRQAYKNARLTPEKTQSPGIAPVSAQAMEQ